MENFDIAYWIVLITALIVSSYFYSKRKRRFSISRDKFISKYSFKEADSIFTEMHKHGFNLLSKASGGYGEYEFDHVISKSFEKEEFFIFDFVYTPKSQNKSTATGQATLRSVLIKLKDRELFTFELFPENIFEKIKQAFGVADIDFDEYKQFSKMYVLKGDDETRVRNTFSQPLIRKLESTKGMCIEARKSCLLIYNLNHGEFADYEALYKDAKSINEALR